MEGGTTGWAVFGSGTLSSNTSVVHGGTRSLSITGRTGVVERPQPGRDLEADQRQELHDQRLGARAERHAQREGRPWP